MHMNICLTRANCLAKTEKNEMESTQFTTIQFARKIYDLTIRIQSADLLNAFLNDLETNQCIYYFPIKFALFLCSMNSHNG